MDALLPHTDALILESFFDGPVQGNGVFVNRWSKSRKTFTVDIAPAWDGRTLTLVEEFVYSDGTIEHATWQIEKVSPGSYTGTREGVIGTARIWNDGPVVRLRYVLKLLGIGLAFAETMSLRADGTLRGLAAVRKWGIPIGTVEIVMRHA